VRQDRFYPSKADAKAPEDVRSSFERDRDRILYSSALRRLTGVTQVVSASEGAVFHNRLTHTHEVAQVARRMAQRLLKDREQSDLAAQHGGIDPEVCEAAALAHDLGHPPFGHIAEVVLDEELVRRGLADGFEGNAQSFRVVSRLAVRSLDQEGLNLTRALLAIAKYPWYRATAGYQHLKYSAYRDDDATFDWARESEKPGGPKTIEAEIMDWSDDIAYAVHDVEDFYRAGLIPLERLRDEGAETRRFLDGTWERWDRQGRKIDNKERLEDAFLSVASLITMDDIYTGTTHMRGLLRLFTSGLINTYISGLRILPRADDERPRVEIDPGLKDQVTMLKELTWHYVIERPSLASQQHGQKRVVAGLFDIYAGAAQDSSKRALLPPGHQERLAAAEKVAHAKDHRDLQLRTAADIVAGLTEAQAVTLYQRLTGSAMGSILDPIAP
jgi:dGTPase